MSEMELNEKASGLVNDSAEILSVKKALDAYSNPAANLGFGSSNLANTAGYVMNRMSWDYMTLNILFRDNWIAKAIIEKPANEMLKNGFQIQSELDPDKVSNIMQVWTKTKTNVKFLARNLEFKGKRAIFAAILCKKETLLTKYFDEKTIPNPRMCRRNDGFMHTTGEQPSQ